MIIETLNDAVNPKGAIVMTHPTRTQIALSQKPYLGKKEKKSVRKRIREQGEDKEKRQRKEKAKKELIFIHRVSSCFMFVTILSKKQASNFFVEYLPTC